MFFIDIQFRHLFRCRDYVTSSLDGELVDWNNSR
jgi:hypothetical protein